MMAALIANVAVFAAVFVVGFGVERRVHSDAKLEALPWYLQFLVGGLAMSPIVFFEDRLTVGPIDGLTVSFVLSVTLWITLSVVLSQLVGAEEPKAPSGC